jgi:hypothetical protein
VGPIGRGGDDARSTRAESRGIDVPGVAHDTRIARRDIPYAQAIIGWSDHTHSIRTESGDSNVVAACKRGDFDPRGRVPNACGAVGGRGNQSRAIFAEICGKDSIPMPFENCHRISRFGVLNSRDIFCGRNNARSIRTERGRRNCAALLLLPQDHQQVACCRVPDVSFIVSGHSYDAPVVGAKGDSTRNAGPIGDRPMSLKNHEFVARSGVPNVSDLIVYRGRPRSIVAEGRLRCIWGVGQKRLAFFNFELGNYST